MDPFYIKVEEIKENVGKKNYGIVLDLYNELTEIFTEPYHEYEIKRLGLDKLLNGVSKKYFKLRLNDNMSLCRQMIENNEIERAKDYLNEAQKNLDSIHDPFLVKQKIQLKKLRKRLEIKEQPLETYPEPEFEDFIQSAQSQKTIPEFDPLYFKETSEFMNGTLKQNGYSRIKIIPESNILSNIYKNFDHLYYKIHKDSDNVPALISLVFIKIESCQGNIKLRYPKVDYKSREKLSNSKKNEILNDVVNFPIRIFKHLLTSMEQTDYKTFRITTEIFEDLFVKVFPRAKILQHPLRLKNGANQMEIDCHGIIVLKNSLYSDSLPGLRSDHIYFLTRDKIQDFINFQDKKYFAYISAKKVALQNYEEPKQKHGFFGRQSKIGFIATPILLISALLSFLNQDLLTPFLIIDAILTLAVVGHGVFQLIFGKSELYRISEWCILSRDFEKWENVFRFIPDEKIINLISAECSNFDNPTRLRDPKKISVPFLHNFSLRMFLKRKKLQKYYIYPATTKIKSKSREVNRKVKEQYTRISSKISTKLSNASIPKPKIKMKKRKERVKTSIFKSNKPKIQAMRKPKSILTNPIKSVKLTSINSFLDD